MKTKEEVQKKALRILKSRKILQIQLPIHGWVDDHDIKSNTSAAREVVASFSDYPDDVKTVIFRKGKL